MPEASFKTPCFYTSYQRSETFLTSVTPLKFLLHLAYLCVHAHSRVVGVRGQLAGASSLRSLCGSQDLNSDLAGSSFTY